MTDSLRIGIAQLNPTVGDIDGNVTRLREAREAVSGCELLVCSELVLTGYPPEDLVLRRAVIEAATRAVHDLCRDTRSGPAMLVTTPWHDGTDLYNAAVLLDAGAIAAIRYKHDLPNYGVFDEKRVFAPGPLPDVIDFRGVRLGVPICEDMWYPPVANHRSSVASPPGGWSSRRHAFRKRAFHSSTSTRSGGRTSSSSTVGLLS